MLVSPDLSELLDKQYEDSDFPDPLKAPVTALAGVAEADAQPLRQLVLEGCDE